VCVCVWRSGVSTTGSNNITMVIIIEISQWWDVSKLAYRMDVQRVEMYESATGRRERKRIFPQMESEVEERR